MVDNLGQRAADYADFQSGFRRARSERFTLQQQRMQTEEMRRRAEAAQRQAEIEAQRGDARAGMLTSPPSFDLTTGRPMPTAEVPTGDAGLRTPSDSAQPSSAPPSVRDVGPQQSPQVAQLSDADLEALALEKIQIEEAISEGYRLIYEREGRGVDTSTTREQVRQLEQELQIIDARMRGEEPLGDEPERLSLSEYPEAAGRSVGGAISSTVGDARRYLYDPAFRGLGAVGTGILDAGSGLFRGLTGQEASASEADTSQEEAQEGRELERMPSVEVPEDIMREAEAYDNAGTPYDSLIQQAATQYGIDPVIFKRLIGTESSFNPDAVSSLGADAGFGIAQISADHGLSESERQAPAIAIPAGAEIFARMLDQQGGDYLEAIMQYKGASSEQGRANMMRPAQIILAGTEHYPGAGTESARTQTASISPQVRREAEQESEALTSETREQAGLTAQDDVISDPASDRGVSTYSTGAEAPQRVGIDTQRLLRTREGLVRLAQINAEAGTAEGNERFDALYTQIQEIDSRLQFLQGMQGVNEFRMQNNPSRLASVWSAYAGMNIQIQNRTDGTYNIYIEGELAQEGVGQEQIVSSAKQAFSQEYREALAARQAQLTELGDDIRLEAAKRQLEARYKGADVLEVLVDHEGRDIVVFRDQDGTVGAMQYDPGQERVTPGIFRRGQPEVPGSFGSVPIQSPLGATGGGTNFNPDVITNWNN